MYNANPTTPKTPTAALITPGLIISFSSTISACFTSLSSVSAVVGLLELSVEELEPLLVEGLIEAAAAVSVVLLEPELALDGEGIGERDEAGGNGVGEVP